jgi:hypothetical protein
LFPQVIFPAFDGARGLPKADCGGFGDVRGFEPANPTELFDVLNHFDHEVEPRVQEVALELIQKTICRLQIPLNNGLGALNRERESVCEFDRSLVEFACGQNQLSPVASSRIAAAKSRTAKFGEVNGCHFWNRRKQRIDVVVLERQWVTLVAVSVDPCNQHRLLPRRLVFHFHPHQPKSMV